MTRNSPAWGNAWESTKEFFGGGNEPLNNLNELGGIDELPLASSVANTSPDAFAAFEANSAANALASAQFTNPAYGLDVFTNNAGLIGTSGDPLAGIDFGAGGVDAYVAGLPDAGGYDFFTDGATDVSGVDFSEFF
jgi:hypothetical protein